MIALVHAIAPMLGFDPPLLSWMLLAGFAGGGGFVGCYMVVNDKHCQGVWEPKVQDAEARQGNWRTETKFFGATCENGI